MKYIWFVLNAYFLFILSFAIIVIAGVLQLLSPEVTSSLFESYRPAISIMMLLIPVNSAILLFIHLAFLIRVYLPKRLTHYRGTMEIVYNNLRPSIIANIFVVLPAIAFGAIVAVLSQVLNIPDSGRFVLLGFYVLFGAVYYFARKIKYTFVLSAFTVFVGICLASVVYFVFIIAMEFRPQKYFTFPLDDKDSVYVLNYDGDYWVTYYEVRNVCKKIDLHTICEDVFVKKGNTSITYTPVDLQPFLEKPVRIKGSFVPTHGSLSGEEKQFCFKDNCSVSTGPGVWYASPLKIEEIEVVK